ncbi:MAG: VWA domain-containing protein [Bacteroidetes bacterium]|nr:MAG: VWA domain-containing protein [Bacteroidota bacterium]
MDEYFRTCTRIGLIWLISLGGLSLPLPATPVSAQPYHAITAYLNAEMESLWLLHKDLERINRDMNRCLEREQHQAELSEDVCNLHFVSDWAAAQPQQRVLDSLYDAALQGSLALPADHQARIQRELRQVHLLLAPMSDWLKQLETYIRWETYRSDKGFETGYNWLDRFEVCYGDFANMAGKLYFSLEASWQAIPLSGQPNPYSPLVHSLDPVLTHSRTLLCATRDEDRQSLQRAVRDLAHAIGEAQRQGGKLVKALPAQPGSQRDPQVRYRAVLAEARSLLRLAEASLTESDLPNEAKAYGWGYYHYNRFLANKFSRPGASVIGQYNRLLALNPEAGIPQVGEVQCYRTLRPSLPQRPAPSMSPRVAEHDQPTPALAPPGHQHLVVMLDVSGSMHRPEKLPLIKRTLPEVLSKLPERDRVSLVAFSGEAQVLAEQVPVQARVRIQQTLDALQVGGNSLPETGARMAYSLAKADSSAGRRQIVLITDGGFAIEGPLLRLIESEAYAGIPLTILYVGREPEHMQERLSKLAAVGLGTYHYAALPAAKEILQQACSGEFDF